MTKKVLIKCWKPEMYDGADCAAIEITEDLVLWLYRRVLHAKRAYEEGLLGTKWDHYAPTFLPKCDEGPEAFGLEMEEDEFEAILDSNSYVDLPDEFDPRSEKANHAVMRPIVLTITVSSGPDGGPPMYGFYWTGTCKYTGIRVEMYEMPEDVIQEWAELVGCTEALAKVRSCMGDA